MIQHGMTPTQPPSPPSPPVMIYRPNAEQQVGAGRGTFIWGLVLAAIGVVLTLALWPIGFIANSATGNSVRFPLGLGPWMLGGFIPLFVGRALILGYVILRPNPSQAPPAPPHYPPYDAGSDASLPPVATAPSASTDDGGQP